MGAESTCPVCERSHLVDASPEAAAIGIVCPSCEDRILRDENTRTARHRVERLRVSLPRDARRMLEKDGDATNLPESVKRWAATRAATGAALFLHGPIGCGKTHTAVHAVARLVVSEPWARSVAFVSVPALGLAVRARINSPEQHADVRSTASMADVLILDDVHRPEKGLGESALREIVFAAHLNGSCIVSTSNVDPRTLYQHGTADGGEDVAVWSRILRGATVHAMTGRDRRLVEGSAA